VQGDLVGHHVDEMLGPKGAPRRGRSPADAAAVTGLEPALVERPACSTTTSTNGSAPEGWRAPSSRPPPTLSANR
jgi:hypothetical protein